MSIQRVAAEARAVVDRARSLFGSAQPLTAAREPLETAAACTAGVGHATSGLSGELIDRHSDFVGAQTRDLADAGRTDTTLGSQLSSATTATQSGAHQLDAIAARTRTIAASAATARTPAAQRTVLAALRSQVSQADDVVTSTQEQGADIAEQIRGLNYRDRVQAAGYGTGGAKDAPPDPPQVPGTWNGPPPAGEAENTGYWAVDMTRPSNSSAPLPVPAPYKGSPPCVVGGSIDGPTSGVLTVGGQSPQNDDAVGVDLQNTYRFRIAGTQFNGLTQMVQIDGKWYQAQWQSYRYEMNKIPVIAGTGQIPAINLPLMSQAHTWTPVSIGQIMAENSMYPNATFYLPNPTGDYLKVIDGALQTKLPTVPIMTRGN